MTETAPATGPQRLPRHRAVNRLLSLYDQPRYLEIGVARGDTFDKVNAPLKVAVDPKFRFDHVEAQRANPGTTYHDVTSDEYFGKHVEATEKFDVIYLDGLHTFEQTLRDLNNALEHLEPHGVILIDDVRPHTYLASLPNHQNYLRGQEGGSASPTRSGWVMCTSWSGSSTPSTRGCAIGRSATTTARQWCGGSAGRR